MQDLLFVCLLHVSDISETELLSILRLVLASDQHVLRTALTNVARDHVQPASADAVGWFEQDPLEQALYADTLPFADLLCFNCVSGS